MTALGVVPGVVRARRSHARAHRAWIAAADAAQPADVVGIAIAIAFRAQQSASTDAARAAAQATTRVAAQAAAHAVAAAGLAAVAPPPRMSAVLSAYGDHRRIDGVTNLTTLPPGAVPVAEAVA